MQRSTFLTGLAIFSAALAFTACDTSSPVDTGSTAMNKPAPPPPAPNANPAIVFQSSVVVKSTVYIGLYVMDADGSDRTEIFRGTTGSMFRKPTWAPTGSGTTSSPWSVSFTEQSGGVTYLKKLNVWVENGAVKSSAPTTFFSFPDASGRAVRLQAWSPSTTTSEIAYVEVSTNPSAPYSKLFVIPASGGTATELQSSTTELGIGTLAWNHDGSKIAYRSNSSNEGAHIRILDRTSPSTAPQVILANQHYSLGYIDWSRSGTNMIAYGANATDQGTRYLYTTDLSASTPTPTQVTSNSQAVAGSNPIWSPDNSKLMYGSSGSSTGGTITLATGAISSIAVGTGDWRR